MLLQVTQQVPNDYSAAYQQKSHHAIQHDGFFTYTGYLFPRRVVRINIRLR